MGAIISIMSYHLHFLLLVLAGWGNRQQQVVIDYLREAERPDHVHRYGLVLRGDRPDSLPAAGLARHASRSGDYHSIQSE